MSSAAKKNDFSAILFDFDEIKLSDKIYSNFADLIYELAGIDLPPTPKNHALVRNRLVKMLRRYGLDSYEAYWDLLRARDKEVISEYISALTTNMTSFYRESNHFDFMNSALPELMKKYPGELRLWCAAASTRQEPYTMAMTVWDSLGEQAKKVRMLATDIDLEVLKKASAGVYFEREMAGLPPAQRSKYFTEMISVDDPIWRANDQIHDLIRFAPFNLMNPRYEFQHKFHMIFCRNVLIYFDEETTKRVIDNLVQCLAPGGYLVLGHSESGNVKHPGLKSLSRAVYERI
ncbi:chemotaxis protein methyltransferase [Bdellovibrio bacteriovorus W]|nr:chemotaxis protein methyltransferase [Bdellovibrio bacteriovorus W]